MSRIAYNNIFLDPRAATVQYTDVGGSFSVAQPLPNLSKMQLPTFAQFTGATAELDADAGASHSVDVLALVGHTLTTGMQVEFLDGATSLGTVTVANYEGLPQDAILILDSPVSLQTLTVSITGGSIGVNYRIGALWASPSFEVVFENSDFDMGATSLSLVSYAQATGYTAERPSYDAMKVTFPKLTKAEAIGPSWPNLQAIFRTTGKHKPVIFIPIEAELAHSRYCLIEEFNGPRVRSGLIWTANAVAREQR